MKPNSNLTYLTYVIESWLRSRWITERAKTRARKTLEKQGRKKDGDNKKELGKWVDKFWKFIGEKLELGKNVKDITLKELCEEKKEEKKDAVDVDLEAYYKEWKFAEDSAREVIHPMVEEGMKSLLE